MTASVAEAIAQARAASDTDDDDRAMALASDALVRLDPAADPATAWALAELLVELGDNDAAIALAARVTGASPSADGALRHAALLTATGDDEGAAQVLRDAATAYGATLEIVVGVFAPLELSWSAPDDGTPPPAATIAARILSELPKLPRDRALPAMLRFYRSHRLRARQLR